MEAAARATLDAFGAVHVVCNNAGVAIQGALGTIEPRHWDWIIDVNLKSVVYGVETFAPLILAQREGGHVVNTASLAGMVSIPGLEPYVAAKFAVVGMSEGWAQQLAPHGVGVSILCPGPVRTQLSRSARARPERYGGGGAAEAERSAASDAAKHLAAGLDPDVVGQLVVDAVRANELYIFTHPGDRPLVAARFDAILAAYDRAAANPPKVSNP